jgi:serine/threonine-protein kinase
MSEDLFTDRYVPQRVVFEQDFVTRTVAADRILGREVLITQLNGRVGRRAAVQERFRGAARNAVRLSHANIIALYDIGSANGFPFAVQEHTHSEALTEIIAHEAPFHPDDVAVLVEQVAAALDYAHLRDIPHLALSPGCITVDYDGQVLVTDFGIGRVLSEISPTDVENLRYQAPEQVRGETGDFRSDIYSLGVIAYEMLAGRSPFDTSSTDAIRADQLDGSPRDLSQLNADVPPAVSNIVLRSLAKEPSQRYLTAGHFSEALTSWQEPSLVTRPLDTIPYRYLTESTEAMAPVSLTPAIDEPATPGDVEGRSRRGKAVAAWLGVVIGLLALIWMTATLLDNRGDAESDRGGIANATPPATAAFTATVVALPTAPSLVGMTLDDATGSTDLTVRVVATETSDSVPAGQIIRQSPNPGRTVRTGELIVVLSSGAPAQPIQLSTISVADVDFEALAQQLTSLGLNVIQVSAGSERVPEGGVIQIEEESAMPGETVHVLISMGDRVQIPIDLQSQPVETVVERLEEMGLTVDPPIGVSRERIESFQVDLAEFEITDGDVVGIQQEEAGFGRWVERGSTITPVFYDASLDQ